MCIRDSDLVDRGIKIVTSGNVEVDYRRIASIENDYIEMCIRDRSTPEKPLFEFDTVVIVVHKKDDEK